MFCKNCGSSLADNTVFCPNCGAQVIVDAEAVVEPAPAVVPPRPEEQPEAKGNGVVALVLGIISLTTLVLPLVIAIPFIDGILFDIAGIICASIAKKQARLMKESGVPVTGVAKTGRILASIGLPINIIALILTVLFALAVGIYYIVVVGIGALGALFSGGVTLLGVLMPLLTVLAGG